ncbi:hypothetical protein M427DRAFT_27310 [Gonapodya prolifera JEL478]|uniref:Uncharacterized protein n=1 Tax=Gonapodya prolifera (strain JEL478) TaxID=1344416 RepID=A0A139AYA9_GONPJ|nr:hypothetical protein M427DRAFT_27310 [Gonapodya prolifera JEL478]|eukprot:KXS21726.1 hypothetical protein M427DRAFT_27310 [Gonapodya prolifera JEL478]
MTALTISRGPDPSNRASSERHRQDRKGKRVYAIPQEIDLSDEPFRRRTMDGLDLENGLADVAAKAAPNSATTSRTAAASAAVPSAHRKSWWEWLWGGYGEEAARPADAIVVQSEPKCPEPTATTTTTPPATSDSNANSPTTGEPETETWSAFAERMVLDGIEAAAENLESILGLDNIALQALGAPGPDENGTRYIGEDEEEEEARVKMETEKVARQIQSSLTAEILSAGGLIGANMYGYS